MAKAYRRTERARALEKKRPKKKMQRLAPLAPQKSGADLNEDPYSSNKNIGAEAVKKTMSELERARKARAKRKKK